MHPLQLEPLEARVLGVLIEKERTTPDGYPLSLNALVNGCNQKSNRDPVLSLGEREVNDALLRLRVAGLIEFVQLAGSRVEKYAHKAGAALHLEPAELAVLAELLLRGAQQPGELRARAARMHALPTQEALQSALDALAARDLVVQDARRKGERAARWAQLLAPGREGSPEVSAGVAIAPTSPPSERAGRPPPAAAPAASTAADRTVPGSTIPGPAPAAASSTTAASVVADLEARVAKLEAEVADLRARIGSP